MKRSFFFAPGVLLVFLAAAVVSVPTVSAGGCPG